MCYSVSMKTIKEYRIEFCLTQEEVIKKIKMKSRSNFSKIENRKHTPSLKIKRKIAKLFGVLPSDVLW